MKRFRGTQAEYSELHKWIRKNKPQPECCQLCKKTKFVIIESKTTCRRNFKKRLDIELANISGKYKRDINDFMWLCQKCHREHDNINENLKKGIEKRCRYFVFGFCHYYRQKCNGEWNLCDIYKIMMEKNTPVTNVIPSETKT